jgi:TPP-dependent pyruvate/acetoin dehydrogenase alpha subunit
MFETLPIADKDYLSLLDPNGNLNDIPPQTPLLSDPEMLSAYRLMLLARQADDWAVSLNRQGRIHQAPVAREGRLAVAAILPLSLVFDHRVCDGSYAVRFLNRFIELVSKPIRILR